MKVAVFTADENNGGILQFTLMLAETCLNLGHEVRVFVPNIERLVIPEYLKENTIRYRKEKTILGKSDAIKETSDLINSYNPDVFLAGDEAIITAQVLCYINSNISKIITVHDVTPHPSVLSLKRRLVYLLAKIYRKSAFKNATAILLLSENGISRFKIHYKKYVNKIRYFPLGAHPPINTEEIIPEEMYNAMNNKYLLYFGRIEKYKGVGRLLSAYDLVSKKQSLDYKLVIAGKGHLEEDDIRIISANENIILINRYIQDGEMIWLIKNSIAIAAPYIEASQSGVIPMAYHYGKGVIASNIDGLREFVLDSRTGILFSDDSDLERVLESINDCEDIFDSDECYLYEEENLNWSRNLSKVLY